MTAMLAWLQGGQGWWWLPATALGGVLAGWCARAMLVRGSPAPAPVRDSLPPFESIGDATGVGYYHWDMRNNALQWSPQLRAMVGITDGAAVTIDTFRQHLDPEDAAVVDAAVRRALGERGDCGCEFRMRVDGMVRHLRGSGRIAFDADGRALSMSGAVIDISAATEARLAMAQRERELTAIIEHLPDVISRFDLEKRHLFVSPCIEAITGLPPQAFIGKTNAELGMDPVLCMRFGAVLDDVIRNGIVREMEFSYFGPAGDEHFFVTRVIPSFDAAGKVESVMTIAADHTLREIAARRLRASETLLQQADARKNEYLATLAHELRGPLAPIATAVQLMKLSERQQDWRKSRQVIERQVGQLIELVDDLMEVGRISAGKLVLRLARVPLQPAIEHAIESVRPLFDGGGQQLTVEMPEQPVWLDADSTRLTQIFTNLLTNASKYSEARGRVALRVTVSAASVAIVVSDDGIGLSAEAMASIFDMFSQVHAQGRQARGGLGIGLSLVRHLVGLHQGEITVASAGPGKGAQFTVHLPLACAPAGQSDAAPAPTPAAVTASSKRVLVVDDHVDGADTLVALLEALGHTADGVHHGGAAIAAAETGNYDLLLLDLGLPDISGIQVALHVRGKPWGRDLKIVALTGLGQQHDRDLTRLAGFDLHLVKPVRMEDVLELVGNARGG